MKEQKISTHQFLNNFVDFFAVTVRDAIYLILVFVLNDDNEISLAFETENNRFQFQKPMKSRCRHSKQIPVSGKLHPGQSQRKNRQNCLKTDVCFFLICSKSTHEWTTSDHE